MTAKSVLVVDDDPAIRDSLSLLLESHGYQTHLFPSGQALLESERLGEAGCLLLDVRMPDMSGLEVHEILAERDVKLPVIIITGHADVPMAVNALKAGAADFIEKPFADKTILESVREALIVGEEARQAAESNKGLETALALLTPREREVLNQLVQGKQNKVIAYDLGISPRTVEIHRARVMDKMQARNLSHLVRMVLEGSQANARR